jgi:hypothetical protein
LGRLFSCAQPIRSARWDGQHLEFVLHKVAPLGLVAAELVIALGEGAEWPSGGDADLSPRGPAAPLAAATTWPSRSTGE